MRIVSICLVVICGCGTATGADDDDDAVDGGAANADAAPPAPRVEQLIRGDEMTRLVFEIDSVAGVEPRAQTEADLVSVFDELLDKPSGVQSVRDGQLASRGADHAWTEAELREMADDTFDLTVDADTIKLHVMFVDGHSARDDDSSRILGLAWSHTHLAMFEDTIEDVCGGAVGLTPLLRERLCAAAELGVWTHEVGHLIGLVDNGLPMVQPHRDPDHGAHDEDDGCVMYWAYDSDALVQILADDLLAGGDAEVPFDDACLADIAAVRDR